MNDSRIALYACIHLLLLQKLIECLAGAYEEHIVTMHPDKGGAQQTTECTEKEKAGADCVGVDEPVTYPVSAKKISSRESKGNSVDIYVGYTACTVSAPWNHTDSRRTAEAPTTQPKNPRQ